MKNFYNSKLELENKKDRIKVLKYEIEKIDLQLTKITSSMKENSTSGGSSLQSKVHEYTVQKIAKEEELRELENDIEYLEPIIKRMQERVDSMVGIHREIFDLFYGENVKPKHIALMKSYTVQRIYQLLREVNEILGIDDYKKF